MAEKRSRTLSDDDVSILSQVIDWWRTHREGGPPKDTAPIPTTAPEVYIAKVPTAGIPAMSGVVPGSAECDIYRIADSGTATPSLEAVDLYTKTVYNTLSTAASAGYVPISRDKFGHWLISGGNGGTECNVVMFEIVSSDPSTRTALVEIKGRPNGCSDVPESTLGGTVLEVCDPQGCFLNEPNVQLTGRLGWARYMVPVGENICQPNAGTASGTLLLSPYAQWYVFQLCCRIPECSEIV